MRISISANPRARGSLFSRQHTTYSFSYSRAGVPFAELVYCSPYNLTVVRPARTKHSFSIPQTEKRSCRAHRSFPQLPRAAGSCDTWFVAGQDLSPEGSRTQLDNNVRHRATTHNELIVDLPIRVEVYPRGRWKRKPPRSRACCGGKLK